MNTLRFTPARQPIGTGPLGSPPKAQEAASGFGPPAGKPLDPFAPNLNQPAEFAPGAPPVLNQVAAPANDCLTQVALFFPNPLSQSQSLPQAALPLSAAESAAVLRGNAHLDEMAKRRDASLSQRPTGQPLDYAMAKLSTDAMQYPLTLKSFTQVLQSLQQDLPCFRPGAAPLGKAEVDTLNASLKPFGFMTDGKNLYNLMVRAGIDSQTGKRMPITCSQQALSQLLDVCSALQNKLSVIPQQAYAGKSPFHATSLINATDLLDSTPIGESSSTTNANALYLQIQSRKAQYTELLSTGESFINDSIALLDRLMPQQEDLNRKIEAENERQEQLHTRADQQTAQLKPLERLSQQVLDPAALSGLSETDLSSYRQALTPFGLDLQRSEAGDIQYYQAGQAISAQAFKLALAAAMAQQGQQIAQTRQEIDKGKQHLGELRRQSADLSTQIEGAQEDLTKGQAMVTQAKDQAEANRNDIQTLQQNPALWTQLSPEQQQQLKLDDSDASAAMGRAGQASGRAQTYLERSQALLTRSEQLRQAVDQLVSQSQTMLNRLDTLLIAQQQASQKLQAAASDPAAQIQDLIRFAAQLEAELRLAPAPDSSRLDAMAQAWSERLNDAAREFQAFHQAQLKQTETQHRSFEQRAQILREHQAYHQQALDHFASRRHEDISQDLKSRLALFQAEFHSK